MNILVLGLALFIGIHCVPLLPALKARWQSRLGENRYKLVFTLVAVIGIGLTGWGYAMAPFEHLYLPFDWGRTLARAIMPFALILFIAANFPCHIRRAARHPMMIGTLLWASVHLLANGDLASTILFGGFAAWSILAIVGSNKPAPSFSAARFPSLAEPKTGCARKQATRPSTPLVPLTTLTSQPGSGVAFGFIASMKFDFIAIGIGVAAYALLGYFHAALFGVAVL